MCEDLACIQIAIYYQFEIMYTMLHWNLVCASIIPKTSSLTSKQVFQLSCLDHGVLAPRPYLGAIKVEEVRNRHKQGTESTQNGQRPMHTHIAVEGYGHFKHPSRCDVSNESHTRERARCVRLIAINDVLIAADEYAQDAVSKKDAGSEGRPVGDPRIIGPSHPEHTDWNSWRSEHGKP